MQLGTWILALSVFLLWLVLENLEIKTLYKAIALFYMCCHRRFVAGKNLSCGNNAGICHLAMLYLLTDKSMKNTAGSFAYRSLYLHFTYYNLCIYAVICADGIRIIF